MTEIVVIIAVEVSVMFSLCHQLSKHFFLNKMFELNNDFNFVLVDKSDIQPQNTDI